MEVERYKMIYTRIVKEELKWEFPIDVIELMDKGIEKNNIRILGNDFVKNNKNKGKLIINNKKYKLKEFINDKEFKDDKRKINMILCKELSNISHLFDNCYKLKEIFFCDDAIFIDDEASIKLEEYNDYDINFDYNNNINNYSENSLYKNLRTDNSYSNFSKITTKAEREENHDKMIIISFLTI